MLTKRCLCAIFKYMDLPAKAIPGLSSCRVTWDWQHIGQYLWENRTQERVLDRDVHRRGVGERERKREQGCEEAISPLSTPTGRALSSVAGSPSTGEETCVILRLFCVMQAHCMAWHVKVYTQASRTGGTFQNYAAIPGSSCRRLTYATLC